MSVLLLGALLLIAAQCDGNGTMGSSGIEGMVTIGPVCPVESIESPCPDQPYAATIVVRDSGGDEVARAHSGEDGTFRVDLAPGTYTLAPQSPDGAGLPFAAEQEVEVRAGAYTTVTVQYDSGIR